MTYTFTIYANTKACCTPETNMSILLQFKKHLNDRYIKIHYNNN